MKVAIGNFNVFSKYDNLVFGIESREVRGARISHNIYDVINKK